MERKTIGRVSAVGLFALLVAMSGLTKLHGQGRPQMYPNGVVHAASLTPPDFPGGHMAPGTIVSIFGRNFHVGEAVSASGTPLPRQLGPMGTRVLVDGLECPLFFVSEGQNQLPTPPRSRWRAGASPGRSFGRRKQRDHGRVETGSYGNFRDESERSRPSGDVQCD